MRHTFSSIMEEEQSPPLRSPRKKISSQSAIRFLGLLKQPDPDSNAFELDESDVVWSSDLSGSSNNECTDPNPTELSTVSNFPTNHRHHFRPDKLGLSAALIGDRLSLVQRKQALNPSLSAASAARAIPLLSSSSSGKYPQSAPVNVPVWSKANRILGSVQRECFDDDGEAEEEKLPPHEIVARSHAMTFSVVEGVGRTLKGRDLHRVRNAVWRKTGFLD